jgi:hypothetical protein
MRNLTQSNLAGRRRFDWRVVRQMNNQRYRFTAHRTAQDAESGRHSIEMEDQARYALHYRAEYGIKTLIGPGAYSSRTVIRVDVSHPAYPFTEPTGWPVKTGESKVPYSPHFADGLPVCNGSIWRSDGNILLGHYLIHLARLLNWQEELSPEYGGYNPAAVQWWRKNINRPLDPKLVYPALPLEELYGKVVVSKPSAGGFRAANVATVSGAQGGFRTMGQLAPATRS